MTFFSKHIKANEITTILLKHFSLLQQSASLEVAKMNLKRKDTLQVKYNITPFFIIRKKITYTTFFNFCFRNHIRELLK